MDAYTLTGFEHLDVSALGPLSSLIFHVPAPESWLPCMTEHYQKLRKENNLDDQPSFNDASVKLALKAYLSLEDERLEWTKTAQVTIRKIITYNKSNLRHVELILPVDGVAHPIDLLESINDIENLESFSLQWPLRGSGLIELILIPQFHHVVNEDLGRLLHSFGASLNDFLTKHAKSLKRLRISLPKYRNKVFSVLSPKYILPALPHIELLDMINWSPTVNDLDSILSEKTPTVHHIVLDHGAEIPISNLDDDEDEDDLREFTSWRAFSLFLSSNERLSKSLRSVSVSWMDRTTQIGDFMPATSRLSKADLKAALRENGRLRCCAAWPQTYEFIEPKANVVEDKDKDLNEHSEGCGHLAYPEGQRPS